MASLPVKNTGLPKIVIIGRPNVGKSTLFNRLIGLRRSITDAIPGVTRDAVESQCRIGDLSLVLIDTGGYTTEKTQFSTLVSQRAVKMAGEADLVLLLVDVHTLDSDDYDFIEKMRVYADKLILVVNKVDNAQKENLIWNFYEIGFKEVVSVSAAHGRNMDLLEEKITLFFKDFVKQEPARPDNVIRIAIMGKPNTGKSTLANLLSGEEKSLVSAVPGTTRDVIASHFSFEGKSFEIMDTAGIRRKKKVADQVEYYSVNRAIATIGQSDVILLLVESTAGISDQDKKIAQLAVEKGRGIILVLSKWDLLEDVPNRLQAMEDRTRFFFPVLFFAPLVPISAQTGFGINKLLKSAVVIKQQLEKRVETPRLNTLLSEWIAYYPLRNKGNPIKILYATQVTVNPVKFVFFVSRKEGFRKEYITYLKNKIRSDLGFDKIPFSLDLRTRS